MNNLQYFKKVLREAILMIGIGYGIYYTLQSILGIVLDVINGRKGNPFLDAGSSHWQFRSFSNMITLEIIKLTCYILYLTIGIVSFKTKNKYLFAITMLADMAIIILTIRYNVLFEKAGHDHYPVFDPYFF